MSFGTSTAARFDVEFATNLGVFRREMTEIGREYTRTTGQMSTEALRYADAEDKLDKAIARHGPASSQARRATIAYRREIDGITKSTERENTALNQNQRELNQTQRELDQTQRQLGQLVRGAVAGSGAMDRFGRSIGFLSATFLGGAGLVYAIRQASEVGSNLVEQTNKVDVVFGRSAGTIKAWSHTTAEGIGLASDQALEAAGTFGNLFNTVNLAPSKNAELSKSLVDLAADLASFNNADPTDVLEALRSGVIGEAEPMRKYGVLLSEARVQQEALRESGKTNVNQLTNQEKVLARVALIYHDTAKAQGDFGKTSGSLANQQRILSANVRDFEGLLGIALNPAILDVTKSLNDWLGDSANQARVQRDLNEAVRAGTRIAHGLADGIHDITPAAKAVIGMLGGFEHAAETALILGLLLKARKAAAGIGLITVASGRARTAIVADAAVEQTALAGTAVAAERSASRIQRALGSLGGGGRAAGIAGLLLLPTAVDAVAGGTPAGGVLSAGAQGALYGGVIAGPYGALFGGAGATAYTGGKALGQKVFGTGTDTSKVPTFTGSAVQWYLEYGKAGNRITDPDVWTSIMNGQLGASDLQKLKPYFADKGQYGAAVTFANQTGAPPSSRFFFGGTPGKPTPPRPRFKLTPREQRQFAIDNANLTASSADDLTASRAVVSANAPQIAFLQRQLVAGRGNKKKELALLQQLQSESESAQSTIDSVNSAASTKAAAAARKTAAQQRKDAAAKKKAAAAAQRIRDEQAKANADSLKINKQLGSADISGAARSALGTVLATIPTGLKLAEAQARTEEQRAKVYKRELTALNEQLTTARKQHLSQQQILKITQERQQVQKRLDAINKAKKNRDPIYTLAQLQEQAQSDLRTYGSTLGLTPQNARGGLDALILQELRRANAHARATAAATGSLSRSKPTAIQGARALL